MMICSVPRRELFAMTIPIPVNQLTIHSAGIDAFALNIGVDGYTNTQLQFAYESAARNGMNVFISFDFNWYHIDQGSAVGSMIAQYKNQAAQLYLDDRVFASSFAGDGVDVAALKSAAGENVFWVPNFHPGQGDVSAIDGALNWMVSLLYERDLLSRCNHVLIRP